MFRAVAYRLLEWGYSLGPSASAPDPTVRVMYVITPLVYEALKPSVELVMK
jgi:hypothetical protein